MTLLYLLARLAPDLGITMVVAHADHGLRPDASEKEATLVQQASTSLGLDCHITRLEVTLYAKNNGLSLEEAARDLRYSFFEKLAADTGANKIAVAHTADDQAEEILLRLIRGSGRKGLAGMALLRDGRIVRPLLGVDKNILLLYIKDKGISFTTDESNSDRRYLRNKIRLDLLPYLATFNPNIANTLRQTATILQDEDYLLDTLTQSHYRRIVHENNPADPQSAIIELAPLIEIPIALARRILEKVLIHVGAKPQYKHIESLIVLASKGQGQIHLSNGLRAIVSSNDLHLYYPWGKKSCRGSLNDKGSSFLLSVEGPGRYYLPETRSEILVEVLKQRPEIDSLKNDPADFFDADKVQFPITIRNRLPNDRLCPMGMTSNKSKKVSEILSKKKIPLQQRTATPIVTCGNKVIAILGVCIDDQVKITATTTALIKVTTSSA